MVKTQYTFMKIPLDVEVKNKYPLPKNFGPMEELYLGLMENKLKIKPELVGKPFDFKNSDKHDFMREKFNSETSRLEYDDEGSAYDEEDFEEGSETGSEDCESNESNDDNKEFNKYIDKSQTPHETKPWVSGSYKKHDIPSLDQLMASGKVNSRVNPGASTSAPELNQEDKKRELMFKFEILRKSYKNHTDKIPECTIYTPLEQMENMYEITKKHLKLDDSVDGNKKKLIYGCMFVEWVLGRFFKLDMEGFTRHQILNIDSYDKLLFELGEKSYGVAKKEWPVEARLAILIFCNAAGFVISKMLDGGSLVNILNTVLASSGQSATQVPKRKMRGPTIDPNELP